MDSKQLIINKNPDSIELGTPSKGGAIKVYGDFAEKEEFKIKISNAIEVRKYFNTQIELELGGT